MKYIEITVETSESGIEPLTALLMEAGAESVEIADPRDILDRMANKASYEWDYVDPSVEAELSETPRIMVYAPDDASGRALARRIRKAAEEAANDAARGAYGPGVDLGTLAVTEAVRDDGEWKDKWKEYFRPFRVSDRIVICPTWEETEVRDEDILIRIDPGMAFGTGTHETTSMCLALLEQTVRPGQSVLDCGTGSGILSIAAAKLGAGEVLGIDIDPEAVRVAKENIERNGVSGTARAEQGDLTKGVPFTADLVVGNLMAELIVMLTPDIAAHLAPGGRFISSGILTEKEDLVRGALEKEGFEIRRVDRKGEWCAILADRAVGDKRAEDGEVPEAAGSDIRVPGAGNGRQGA